MSVAVRLLLPRLAAVSARFALRACVATILLFAVTTGAATESPRDGGEDGKDRAALLERARSRLAVGDGEEAARLYAAVLERFPGDSLGLEGRIRALLVQDQWRQALAEAREFHVVYPGPLAASAYGQALLRAGHPAEAFELLDALREGPAPPARALLTLGRLEAARGRREKAITLADRALVATPGDPDVLLFASGMTDDRAEAVTRLERFLASPDGSKAERRLAARQSLELWRALGDRRVWTAVRRPPSLDLKMLRVRGPSRQTIGFAVEVEIGSKKPVRLLLDTGAAGVHLIERVVRTTGFEPLAVTTALGGADGTRQETTRGVLPTLRIGDLEFRDALVTTLPGELDPTGRYHGLLGIESLEGYRITLDFSRSRLILDQVPATSAGEPYWMFDGQLLVSARANGTSGLFLLDSGAGATVIDVGFARRVPSAVVGQAARGRGLGGLAADVSHAGGVTVGFLGRSTAGPIPALDLSPRNRLVGIEVSGLLGLDLLDRARIVIDTRTRRVSLDPGRAR